jgi:hypothetical protein
VTKPQMRRRPHLVGASENVQLGGEYDKKCTPADAAGQDRLDAERESLIDGLRLEFLGAATSDERHSLWSRMKAEIASRSPAQVQRLERERGLFRSGGV